jgi:hypothetical protein
MRPVEGEAAPDTEVDEVRWLGLPEAAKTLTRDGDRAVLAALERYGS